MRRLGKGLNAHQEASRKQAISSGLDFVGHVGSHRGLAGNNPVEVSFDAPNLEPDGSQGPTFGLDERAKVSHDSQFVVRLQTCQDFQNAFWDTRTDNTKMEDRWPPRLRFLELLEEWELRTGKTSADFARAVGRAPASIYTYRTRKDSKPPHDLVLVMCGVLGCDESDLIPASAKTVAGTDMHDLSEGSRVLAQMAFNKFKDPDLTDEDRQDLFNDWVRDYERIKAMKARHQKPQP